MRKASAAAAVEARLTTTVPGPTPNSAPAAMVRGMAGTMTTSSAVYTTLHARPCLHTPSGRTKVVATCLREVSQHSPCDRDRMPKQALLLRLFASAIV